MKFCDKLANLRKKNNMSQEQLADKLGVSRQAVSKWESGSSVPDMDKIMSLCKILNCSLDDLVDDGATGNSRKVDTKISWNQYYQEILDFITKTLNMFWSMRLVEKVKCILEMIFVVLIIYAIWGIVGAIISSTFDNIILVLPDILYRTIYSIFSFAYRIFGVIVGFVLLIHIFKIRYLDYFITIEDEAVKTKKIEAPIDEKEQTKDPQERKFIEKKKNTIIIRDPKHTSYSFFGSLAKIVVLFIKGLLIFFALPCIFCFIGFVFITTGAIWFIKDGIFFLGVAVALIGCVLINYLILKMIYNFVLEQNIPFKKIFQIFMIGLVFSGVGTGISFCNYLTFEKDASKEKTVKTTKTIPMQDNIFFEFLDHDNVEWIEDETQEDIQLEITHNALNTPVINYYRIYHEEDVGSTLDIPKYINYQIYFGVDEDFIDQLNWMIEHIKEKKRIDVSQENLYQITITTTSENISKLKDNYQKIYYDL